MRLPGGPVSLARDVPLTIGPEPLSPARLLIARALLTMRPSRRDFQIPMTSEEAARAIDAAFNAESAKRLERAVKLSGRNPSRWLKLGDAYFKTLRYGAARKAYQRALELGDPEAPGRLKKLESKLGPEDEE